MGLSTSKNFLTDFRDMLSNLTHLQNKPSIDYIAEDLIVYLCEFLDAVSTDLLFSFLFFFKKNNMLLLFGILRQKFLFDCHRKVYARLLL